jgi:hypothetical protein
MSCSLLCPHPWGHGWAPAEMMVNISGALFGNPEVECALPKSG